MFPSCCFHIFCKHSLESSVNGASNRSSASLRSATPGCSRQHLVPMLQGRVGQVKGFEKKSQDRVGQGTEKILQGRAGSGYENLVTCRPLITYHVLVHLHPYHQLSTMPKSDSLNSWMLKTPSDEISIFNNLYSDDVLNVIQLSH